MSCSLGQPPAHSGLPSGLEALRAGSGPGGQSVVRGLVVVPTDSSNMPESALSGPGDPKSTLRRLKFVVVILILSNIALGVYGFCFLRALDRKYSSLISLAV